MAVMLSIPEGMNEIASNTGFSNITIALSKSSSDEASSNLSPDEINTIKTLNGILKRKNGAPMVAPQIVASATISSEDDHATKVLVRGITQETLDILNIENKKSPFSRAYPGQLIIGDKILENGFKKRKINIRNVNLIASSTLVQPGSLWESELWIEMTTMMSLYNNIQISSLWIYADTPNNAKNFELLSNKDPRLSNVRFINQKEYYETQIKNISRLMNYATYIICLLLGLASTLTIYTATTLVLDGKRKMLRTLQAIGFPANLILISILLEIIIIGIASSCVTSVIAFTFLDGKSFGTSSFNQSIYAHFSISLGICIASSFYCTAIAFFGGLFPAIYAINDKNVSSP
ncbi:MAG: hypothetical protein QM581_09420 [Pseudomonas sp.]